MKALNSDNALSQFCPKTKMLLGRDALERAAQAVAGHLTTDDEMQQDFCLEVARDVIKAVLVPDEFPASHFAHRFEEDHWPR